MVRLYKEQFGRGPTKVRTHWCGSDVITVVLEDTLTPAERNLAKMGEHERLREMRMFFQYATVREFCTPIEEITGRRVRSLHQRHRHGGRRARQRALHPAPFGLRRPVTS
jgi:uncharacterized protein YbcI